MSESQSVDSSAVNEQDSTPDEAAFIPDDYLPGMVRRDQWMNWFQGDGGKVPVTYNRNTTGKDRFRWTVRENWRDFEDALWWAENRSVDGVTFVLSKDDEFLVIDGDDVINEEGRIHPGFLNVIKRAGTYADVSFSKTGIHIILRGELPKGIAELKGDLPERPDFPDASVEVYDSGRHMVMTGNRLKIAPKEAHCHPELIDDLVEEYGPKPSKNNEETETETGTESNSDDESAPVEAVEYDEGEKPDEMPPCYYAALKARERPPEGANEPRIDLLAVQLGIWADFTDDEIVSHFEEYCPAGKWNEEITRRELGRQRDNIESGEYQYPPSPKPGKSLVQAGILSEPYCNDCSIHGTTEKTYEPCSRMPSIHSLRPEDRQEVSGRAIKTVSKALEHLHIASAAEVTEYTGYSPKQTYNALNNDDWRREFRSIKVGRTKYWFEPLSPIGITEERLSELPMSLSEFVQLLAAGQEAVDTDTKKAFLDAVYEHGPATAQEISDETDTSVRYVRRYLNEFVELRFLENCLKIGTRAKAYRVNPKLVS